MSNNYDVYLNDFDKKLDFKFNKLLNSGERELIYYIHFLQKDRRWCRYISNVNYNDIKDIKRQIKNAIIKFEYQDGCADDFINRMLDNYHKNIIQENKFEWFRNDKRAGFWLLLEMLNQNSSRRILTKIQENNYLNLHSGSIYYSVIAWFDKFTDSRDPQGGRGYNERILKNYNKTWFNLDRNSVSTWLLSINNVDEIDYCFNYLQGIGMSTLDLAMDRKEVEFFLQLGEMYNFEKKDILIAFSDYLFSLSDAGVLAVENLKMKMASALSSWKNRKNKEGYIDVHFDIKKENISKLESLKKRFNLMSKKEVVNELIERVYNEKE